MSVGAFGMLLFLSRAGFDCENLDDLQGPEPGAAPGTRS